MDLTFDDFISQSSCDQDRKLIKELVELRQCKTECEQLILTNRTLMSTLTEMEVRATELEVKLNAKEIEISHLKTKLKRFYAVEAESTTNETISPTKRSELDRSEDLQLAKDAFEKELKEKTKALQEAEFYKAKFREANEKLKEVTYEKDALARKVDEFRMGSPQEFHRKTNTMTKVSLTETSEISSSICKEINTHQLFCGPKITHLNSQKHNPKKNAPKHKYTPSFMRHKKNPRKKPDETFADSFPEEKEH